MSRNAATVKVAEAAGYGRVASLWKKIGAGTPPQAFPSIALGVFEATPLEIAAAYTLFPNNGVKRPAAAAAAHHARRPRRARRPSRTRWPSRGPRALPGHQHDAQRVNEGTGAGVRAAGFSLDAAGKTGTTNDLRDAWFVGFTPELLTVVWVGLDESQPLGLSGAQAALPIWTAFMTRALAGHADQPFDPPPNITFAEIDRDTGQAGRARLPARVPRVVRRRHRAGDRLSAAQLLRPSPSGGSGDIIGFGCPRRSLPPSPRRSSAGKKRRSSRSSRRRGLRLSASARRCSSFRTAAPSAPSAAAATRTTPSGRHARPADAQAALITVRSHR